MFKKKSKVDKFITEKQWDELKYLIDIMPKFYQEIQDSKLKVYEYNFNDYSYQLEKVNEEPLSYREFEYRVSDSCELKGGSAATMIKLGESGYMSRDICWNSSTGKFYRQMSTIPKSHSPKEVLKNYLLQVLSNLMDSPIDHFDQQLEDPKGKIKSIIEKYFN